MWAPALRYEFYRAWNMSMVGVAIMGMAPVAEPVEALALVLFFGGGGVAGWGNLRTRRPLREAGRMTARRNGQPRLEDVPPLAVRRYDRDAADLRWRADLCTGAAIVSVAVGWGVSTLMA
jgi:hypothetical protein